MPRIATVEPFELGAAVKLGTSPERSVAVKAPEALSSSPVMAVIAKGAFSIFSDTFSAVTTMSANLSVPLSGPACCANAAPEPEANRQTPIKAVRRENRLLRSCAIDCSPICCRMPRCWLRRCFWFQHRHCRADDGDRVIAHQLVHHGNRRIAIRRQYQLQRRVKLPRLSLAA